MKKILLIILLFVSAKAFAQYPMPPGMSNVLSMSGFFKISGSDTIFVIKGANGNVYPVSSGGNFIRNGTSLQTANFNISGIGRIGDSLLVRGVTRSTGVIQSAANIARGTIIEDTLKASSNSALLIGLDINPGFNDNGHTSVRHMAVKASGSVSPGLDNAYTLGNIFVPGAVQYIWKNAYTYGVESPHNLTLKVDTGNIYLKGIPDTSAGYKSVVITADGRVQTAPYGSGGGNTLYTTDDSLRSDRIVTQNLHPLLFYSNNPTSNLSGVLDLEYNYQNMSVTDSLGNAAQVGTTTRLSNDQSQAFIAVQKGAKLKLIQMNSNPNGHSVDFKGIYFTDDIDSVGAIYTDTTSYKYGKRYNTWIPSWGAVKTRIDSAVAAHTGGITALTGDVTASGTGSVAATLATVNSNVGSFGDATHVGTFTVNGKGLITAASSTAITFPVTASNSVAFTNKTGNISQWTNDSNYITLGSLSATSPIFYNNTTGVISSQAASASQNGYLTSTDWSTFNGKISSTNFVDSETPTGSINSSNTSFTLANTPVSGSLKVYLNGLRLKLTTDYSLSGTTLTMVIAPTGGLHPDILLVDYRK